MSEKSEEKLPSSVRLTRVEKVLTEDPCFKEKIGKKTCKVIKRGQEEPLYFAKEVVDVTLAIHKDGKDAYFINQDEILQYASKILGVKHVKAEAKAEVAAKSDAAKPAESKEAMAAIHELLKKVNTLDEANFESQKDQLIKQLFALASKTSSQAIAVVALLLSAHQIAEHTDKYPGHEKRLEEINKILKEYQELHQRLIR